MCPFHGFEIIMCFQVTQKKKATENTHDDNLEPARYH